MYRRIRRIIVVNNSWNQVVEVERACVASLKPRILDRKVIIKQPSC